MEYLNFDLRMTAGPPYWLIGEQSSMGEAEGILDLDPNDPEIQEALMRLANRQTDRVFLSTFGKLLFDRLFAGEIGIRYEQSTGFTLAQKEKGLRLRLRIGSPELSVLPWELLFSSSRSYLGTSHQSPVVRWLYVPKPIRELQVAMPLRLLVAVPEITEPYPPLDVDREIDGLKTALSEMDGIVETTILRGRVTPEHIDRALMDGACHVLHFIGHAQFIENRGELLLNDENGGMQFVDEDQFPKLFTNQGNLKLIVLNACQGAAVSHSRAFVGIAPKVVATGVPAVVAMQYPIYDSAAVLFARTFYFALFRGPNAGRIDWAMAQARNALARDFPDDREVATPVLYMRTPEGVLFYKTTGSLIRDAAFSAANRDTEKAIEATHRFNQSLASDEDAVKDPALPDILAQDAQDYAWLKKRIAFRNRLLLLAAGLFILFFMFFWTGLFDLLRLDSYIEGLTIAADNAYAPKTVDKGVVIVAIKEEVGPPWRRRYAALLNRLSTAGARVVAFDMDFAPYRDGPAVDIVKPATTELAKAIKDAGRRGTAVVLGFREFKNQKPYIEPELLAAIEAEKIHGIGAICLSGKSGRVSVVPLVIQKEELAPDEGQTFMSISLAAFTAYKGVEEIEVDWQRSWIKLSPLKHGFIPFSEKRWSGGGDCSANAAGDLDADLFIELNPVDAIRNDAHTILLDSIAPGEPADNLRTKVENKIVFVGEHSERESKKVYDLNNNRRFGVELHADAFRTIAKSASGGPIIRPLRYSLQSLLLTGMILIGVFIRFWVSRRSAAGIRAILLIAFPIAYVILIIWFFLHSKILVDWLYHLAGFGLAYYVSGRVEKRWFS
jgi:CHASE2 domain-containing sensor protein